MFAIEFRSVQFRHEIGIEITAVHFDAFGALFKF